METVKKTRIMQLLLVVLCFVFYGNTLVNKFALDDAIVITDNTFTQQGVSGIGDILSHDSFTGFFGKEKNLVAGGRYRPLSIVLFAIEHSIFGKNPVVGHLGNILFFALTCLLLFAVLRRVLVAYDNPTSWFPVSFLATFLFLIHPIHTEVVANIKGLDEILSLLLSLLSWWFLLQWNAARKSLDRFMLLFAAGLSLFLALLSKENAVTFVVIIPVSFWCFNNMRFRQTVFVLIPLVIATALFLKIRYNVLGFLSAGGEVDELMNNPFVGASTAQKFATIVYTLGLYLKLLVFPHPLTYDYYPYHIPLMQWSNPAVLLSLFAYLAIAAAGVWLLIKKHLVGFAILIFAATLSIVSNILFPIGTFMNERFVYMPSVGFALVVAWVLAVWLPTKLQTKQHTVLVAVLLSLTTVAAAAKTISRNGAWYDDLTLFTTDVTVSFNSAKSTCSAGGKLYETAKETTDSVQRGALLDSSLRYLHQSVHIYPNYNDALLLLGNALFEVGKYDSTVYYYKRILEKAPYFDKVYENMPIVLNKISSVDYKLETWLYVYAKNPNNYTVCYQLGVLWGRYKGNLPESLKYLERAAALNPRALEVLKDLGVAYGMSGKYNESLAVLQRAQTVDPNDAQVWSNLAITYQNLGNSTEAQRCAVQAQRLSVKK